MVAAGVSSLKAKKGNGRKLAVKVEASEPAGVKAVLKKGGKRFGTSKVRLEAPGRAKLVIPVRKRKLKGKATLRIAFTDSLGGKIKETHRTRIPRAK